MVDETTKTATQETSPPKERSRLCPCGLDWIQETWNEECLEWISHHSVWDGGVDFGKRGMAPCCRACSYQDPFGY